MCLNQTAVKKNKALLRTLVLTVLFPCARAEWLQSSIFSGGLQTSQIHYNYNEEKDEDHCSSLGTSTPDKAKLYSRRITLSDHAQPFLQAIADNNTQDHTVKVRSSTALSCSPPGLDLDLQLERLFLPGY